jgi:hypothetical protein
MTAVGDKNFDGCAVTVTRTGRSGAEPLGKWQLKRRLRNLSEQKRLVTNQTTRDINH